MNSREKGHCWDGGQGGRVGGELKRGRTQQMVNLRMGVLLGDGMGVKVMKS